MYIPYEKIKNFLYTFLKNNKLKEFFDNKKIAQNLNYIKKNKPKVIKKIKNKFKNNEKINIGFYVYDETKWKCQSLYNIFNQNERFNTKIIVTKNACKLKDNSNYQTKEDIERVYNFFKNKNLNVEYGYDFKKDKFIPFEKFSLDVIFYQHPWYVETSQGPVVCSRFALTNYIPYYFPIEAHEIDVNLRFHKYVENYYILNEYTKNIYEKKLNKKIENLKVVGYPHLDYFLNNQNNTEENIIIYAPHWTILDKGLAYSTFDWSGEYILNYAKKHPEYKFVFKPHPLLFKELISSKFYSKEEAQNYYNAWEKIGIKYEGGDYLELFNKSIMMITDCSSFLGEYLITNKPLIHLMSKNSQFRNSNNPILKAYYRVENLIELEKYLEILPQNDTMKDTRLKTIKELNLLNQNSAKNILDDLLNDFQN